MPNKRNITELEGTVLGVISVKGQCTPYAVRKEFQESQTPYWSGSRGAIYPLIDRLRRQKLIKIASLTEDARGGKLYILTPKGEKVLRDWLYQPRSSLVIGTPPDPLRNRIEFLRLLTPEKRKSFLGEVRSRLEENLKNVLKFSKECNQSNYFDYLPIRGAVLMAQARLDWIEEISEILEKQEA